MPISNIETYISLIIENYQPQSHRSKWTNEEDYIIIDCIKYGLSLRDIHKIISLRTPEAIRTRANHLGYGFYRNRDDGLTYFHNTINHSYRRTKYEIQAWKESVPIPIEPHDSLGKDKKTVDLYPSIEQSSLYSRRLYVKYVVVCSGKYVVVINDCINDCIKIMNKGSKTC